MTTLPKSLTAAQIDLLGSALDLESRELLFTPTGPAQWAVTRSLVKHALLMAVGEARHEDTGEERPAFALTPLGRFEATYPRGEWSDLGADGRVRVDGAGVPVQIKVRPMRGVHRMLRVVESVFGFHDVRVVGSPPVDHADANRIFPIEVHGERHVASLGLPAPAPIEVMLLRGALDEIRTRLRLVREHPTERLLDWIHEQADAALGARATRVPTPRRRGGRRG